MNRCSKFARRNPWSQRLVFVRVAAFLMVTASVCSEDAWAATPVATRQNERLRVMVETDAGGDPDDEQSLVRFLLYANEWDVEGIIANRPLAREKENLNRERTGLGIVRAQLAAYGQCYSNLVQHDPRFPASEVLWNRTVPGYVDSTEGVELILRVVDDPDPRPVWFCNWGTDYGSAPSNLVATFPGILVDYVADSFWDILVLPGSGPCLHP